MINIYRIVVAYSALSVSTTALGATIIRFDDVGSTFLPYSENGLTFTDLPGGEPASVGGGMDGGLVAGTNFVPIRIRVTGENPFDLVSLDIEQIFRDWRFVSSSGGIVEPTVAGHLGFESLVGWKGITSFDLLHDPPEANGSIRVDNITVQFVPEPGTLFLAVVSLLAFLRATRLRTFPLLTLQGKVRVREFPTG